ncbi:MAG: MBL fold metallo-hydrolase, partial [Planctomycetota bacterium]
ETTPATATLTRRQALGLGTAAAAAGLVPAAHAVADDHLSTPATIRDPSADPAAFQGAGFYRLSLGDVEITVLNDGWFPIEPAHPTIGANVSADEVHGALRHAFVPADRVIGHINTLLVNTGERLILLDVGCGDTFGPTNGRLRDHLARAGAEPGDIDLVVLTHLHLDHVGGLATADGIDWLPNATFVMHEAERGFWSADTPDFSKSGVPESRIPTVVDVAQTALRNIPSDRLELVRDKRTQLDDALAVYHAPGHTPGHLVAGLYGEAGQFGFLSDLVVVPDLQFRYPGWHYGFDTDPVESADTRQRILKYYADHRRPVAGSHLTFPGVGHVRAEPDTDGFAYVPAVWRWDPDASAAYQNP